MGRFAKLNKDINKLAEKIMQDQDLCKLIYYPNTHPLEKPDINGEGILDKRLLLFTPKIPLAGESEETQDDGTYVMIRPTRMTPSRGGYFIISLLIFDIYCHKDVRDIYYKDEDSGDIVKGDRALLIMDKIMGIMDDMDIGIGKDNIDRAEEVSNRNTTFSGYAIGYVNVDFSNQSK